MIGWLAQVVSCGIICSDDTVNGAGQVLLSNSGNYEPIGASFATRQFSHERPGPGKAESLTVASVQS